MKIEHNHIGAMEILLQFETEHYGRPQYVAFAKSFYVRRKDRRIWNTYSNSNRLKPTYYLMWSNTPDMHLAGTTELQTKSGKSMTYKSAFAQFKEALKALPHITFNKI